MSLYFEDLDVVSKNIDYDLEAAFYYNRDNVIEIDKIKLVLAMIEGEHDGADYVWIAELTNDMYAYIQGGCDYTGWDCQSHLDVYWFDTLKQALEASKVYYDEDIYSELKFQLENGKNLSWREKNDQEFLPKVKSKYLIKDVSNESKRGAKITKNLKA